ncbi:hypothetical protein DFP72DRAFT_614654 [Ephemerocybe angulata]|uniref:Uncharacterized protein n=1 Tax=Ephemerocybe angulata TaxID=980116 RepID=A0A8H6HH77_9AGAR|nr:hypothetical protein DFP72DRAFT_614654 [Tulosesus angulatus]
MNFKALSAFSAFVVVALAAPQGETPLTVSIQSETAPQTCGYVVLSASGGTKPYTFTIHDAAAPFAQIGDSYGPTVEDPLVWVGLKVPTGTNAFFQAVDADGHVAATNSIVFIEGPTDDCL